MTTERILLRDTLRRLRPLVRLEVLHVLEQSDYFQEEADPTERWRVLAHSAPCQRLQDTLIAKLDTWITELDADTRGIAD